MTIAIVWKFHAVSSVRSFPLFRGALLSPPSILHMGVVSFGEIVVNFYKTTRPHVSEKDIFITIAVKNSNTERAFMITQCICYWLPEYMKPINNWH